jgi:hypothetical protein
VKSTAIAFFLQEAVRSDLSFPTPYPRYLVGAMMTAAAAAAVVTQWDDTGEMDFFEMCRKVEGNHGCPTALNLSDIFFDGEDLVKFARALQHNTIVETLLLSEMDMEGWTAAPFAALGEMLAVNNTLRQILTGEDDEILTGEDDEGSGEDVPMKEYPTNEGIRAIAKALKTNTSLVKFDINFSKIDNEFEAGGMDVMADALVINSTLQDIRLFVRTAAGARAIARILEHNTSLFGLDLVGCSLLDADSCRAFVKGVEHNTTLEELSLVDSLIDVEGIGVIATALKKNACLKKLDVSGLLDDGIKFDLILDALEVNRVLQEIDASRSTISESGAQAIARVQEADALAEMLRVNRTLSYLEISGSGCDFTAFPLLLGLAIRDTPRADTFAFYFPIPLSSVAQELGLPKLTRVAAQTSQPKLFLQRQTRSKSLSCGDKLRQTAGEKTVRTRRKDGPHFTVHRSSDAASLRRRGSFWPVFAIMRAVQAPRSCLG